MKKLKSTILATLLSITTAYGQITTNYSDYLLATSFKAFNSVDFEMANHILPFLKKRFLNELKDSASFSNHYDSLSKYIGIRFSSDSLLKTYCWSERSGGCCHTSSAYAQFKTKSGKFNYLNLEETEDGGEDYFITDLQLIEIERKTYYLILGWGTCCGGKHYGVARIYEIRNDSLHKCDSLLDHQNQIFIEANRTQNIELKYSPESKILSYYSYGFDGDVGFYTNEKTLIKLKLSKEGFIKMKF